MWLASGSAIFAIDAMGIVTKILKHRFYFITTILPLA
jgi:hypothetical protein